MIKNSLGWLIVLVLCAAFLGKSQSRVRTWTQTTANDFLGNQLTNLIVANSSGGEVQFPFPILKNVEDHNDQLVFRRVARNVAGKLLRTWVRGGDVYVQEYDAAGKEITSPIVANTVKGVVSEGASNLTIFGDGTYMVVWMDADGPESSINYGDKFGQVFRDDSVMVGGNFKINDAIDGSDRAASVFANPQDQLFWILYDKLDGTSYRIFIQKRDKNGNLVGNPIHLNPIASASNEFESAVACDTSGFTAVWSGANGRSGTSLDVFYRKFNLDGSAKTELVKMNDDSVLEGQYQPDLAVDEYGNALAVWADDRDSKLFVANYTSRIYGQLFDNNGQKIGANIRMDSSPYDDNHDPDIDYHDSEFQLSWHSWDPASRTDLTFVNKWLCHPKTSGEMISTPFVASQSGAAFRLIAWDASISAGSRVTFMLRSAKTPQSLQTATWYGPTGSTGEYDNGAGQNINPIHSGDKYIQYRAMFFAHGGTSPILRSTSVVFLPTDSIPPSVPRGLEAVSAHAKITFSWDRNDDADLLQYVIHRGTRTHEYDSAWTMTIPASLTTVEDAAVRIGQVYYYAMVAVDSSHNESSYSNEVSAVAVGQDIYVSAAASLGGDGSISMPFNTIQKGIDAAKSGDTVRVGPGSYSVAFTMKNGISIVGGGPDQCSIKVAVNASDSCVIKALTFNEPLSCTTASPTITENVFKTNLRTNVSAIDLRSSSSPIISKNLFVECDEGISMQSNCGPIIRNNLMIVNSVPIVSTWYDSPTIVNNTAITKTSFSFSFALALSVKIENNIFVALDSTALSYYPPYSPRSEVIEYNDFWNANHLQTNIPVMNLFSDPLFVNPDLLDYRLQFSSPCINAGNPDPAYNDVDGTRNDMGAFGGPDPMGRGFSVPLTRSISASSQAAYPGDTALVTVDLDNCAGVAKAEFTIKYDPMVLKFLERPLTAGSGYVIQKLITSADKIRILACATGTVPGGQKRLTSASFAVESSSRVGTSSPLTIGDVVLTDAAGAAINVRSVTDGVLVVNTATGGKDCIFVDASNSGVQDGTRYHPFSAITTAIDHSNAGDTILVAGGEYTGSLSMKESLYVIGSGGSVTKLILPGIGPGITFTNIKSGQLTGFTFTAGTMPPPSCFVLCDSSSPLISKNRFEGVAGMIAAVDCLQHASPAVQENYFLMSTIRAVTSSPLIKNNVFELPQFDGINCTQGSAPLIVGNRIDAQPASLAVWVEGTGATIRNNTIFCAEAGFGIGLSNANDTRVFNNFIVDKSSSGEAIVLRSSSNTQILNNTLVTHRRGIEEQACQSTILNNIVTGNADFGLQVSQQTVHDYNDVWNNLVNIVTGPPGANDIAKDPLFVSATSGDFKLRVSSPCINSGNPDPKYNDLDGSRNDIGAFGGPYADSSWFHSVDGAMSIDSDSAGLSDTAVVMVRGTNLGGSVVVNVALSFDPASLRLVSAGAGDIARCFSLEKDNLSPGIMSLTLKGTIPISNDDGILIKLLFTPASQGNVNAVVRLDSASATDERTYTRIIRELGDGRVILAGVSSTHMNGLPRSFELFQNFPNPFNPSTTISFSVPRKSRVQLSIFNLLGQKVVQLVEEELGPGFYERMWSARDASGMYFYRIEAISVADPRARFVDVRKMLLIK
jgi:parallel beta-helix repeat protein